MPRPYDEKTLDILNNAESTREMLSALDWDALWELCAEKRIECAIDRRVVSDAYADTIMEIMGVRSGTSVLVPMASGGSLCVRAALAGSRVTAINDDDAALERVQQRAKDEWVRPGLITKVHGNIYDDWSALNISPHTVVVLSRALIAHQLKKTLEQISNFALKRAVVSVEAYPKYIKNGESFDCADHILVVNQLFELGYNPSIKYVLEDNSQKMYAVIYWSTEK
ncbi:MAG: hypothetical protein Q4E22_02140 [Coriobacteriia bacterium]|nr:hypothetical protein [Coriobacteriia bacterium]